MKRIKSAGRALSLRVKFQGSDTVQLTVLDSKSQQTLQFMIPLRWDNEPLSTPVVLEENGIPQNSESLGFKSDVEDVENIGSQTIEDIIDEESSEDEETLEDDKSDEDESDDEEGVSND